MLPPLSRGALAQQMAAARSRIGLSIRRAAAIAEVPASTAQGWLEGRHLPIPSLMPQFMTLLRALQLVTVQNETAWAEALDRMRRSSIVAESPYVGLRPYATTESSLFVGRERSLEELLDACSRTRPPRIVMVVGASGAGKSSLLAAGLIGRGTAPDGPLSHLNPVQSTVRDLLGWKTPTEATLLVVDQFEELQQLEATEAEELVDTLCRLPDHVTCVIGLNANAVGTVLRQERLAPFLASPVLVGPLTTAEYRQIIEVPARHHGRAVSTELTHVLIRDLHQYGYPDPGIVLPLLSNTLKRCWNAASGETLTTSDYLASGGLWTSLNDEAEAVWQDLSAQDRPLVRRLMLSLVVVDANRLLRRSIPFGSLSSQMVPVAEAFIASRLLTHSEDHLTITHEALLTRWHRLRGWVEQEEATLLVGRRIHMATKLWDEGGRAPEGLMPVEAEMWQSWARAEDAPVISKNEHEFIDASLALGRAHEEEQENRLKHTRRQRRTALGIATVAVVLAVVAAFLGIHSAALTQQANTAARAARAQQLALVSDQIRNTDPNEAAQLAVAAHRLEENPRTRSTVIESAGGTAPLRINGAAGNTMVAVAPGSDIVLRGDSQGNLAVWRDGNLKSEPELVETDGGQLFAVQPVLRDGRYLVIVAGQRTASVWDLTTSARKLGEWAVAGVTSYSAAWQGTVALIGNLHGEVQRIDLTNPERPEVRTPLLTGEDVAVTALTATPDLVVASASRNRLALFDSAGTALPDFQVPGQVMSLDVSEDGKEILAGSSASKALLLEVSGTALRTNHEFLMKSGVHAVRHLGDQVALGGSQGEVVIANRTGEITERRPLRSVVTSISRGSAGLLTGTAEGTLSLWPPLPTLLRTNGVKIHDIRRMGGKTIITTADGPRVLDSAAPGSPELTVPTSPGGGGYLPHVASDVTGSTLATQSRDGKVVLLRLAGSGYETEQVIDETTTVVDLVLSPDGRRLAIGHRSQVGYDIYQRGSTGWEPTGTLHAWPGGLAFNSDGTLVAAMSADGTGYVVAAVTDSGPEILAEAGLPDRVVPSAFEFSPSGLLAVGALNGGVSIIDLSDPTKPHATAQVFDAHASLERLRFSPDGNHLLATSVEGDLWVWERTGEVPALSLHIEHPSASIAGADLVDGQLLLALSDNTAVAWPGNAAAAAADLCSRLGDPLTSQEWAQLAPGVPFMNGCS